ncbi:MAG: nucleotidyltransferase family protein [Clostridia bacterium]|nr:nucleotidyltransferase family protein [Clostridia bacterium]
MNEQIIQTMFALIRKVICGTEVSEKIKSQPVPEILPQLYVFSKSHDMAHIIAQGLGDLGLLGDDEISAKFQKQQMLAVYRYQRINHAFGEICKVLEDEKISFVSLKGSVMRRYYPEPWMRTSSDIDFLVKINDIEKIKSVLESRLKIQYKSTWSHEHSFFTESGVHIEFHDNLNPEDNRKNNILENAWNYIEHVENSNYHFEMTDEMFYFYHIAHMAKHVEYGGCGIRPFLDLWILEHRVEHNQTARDELLMQGRLLTFANACRKLSAVWFDAAEHNEMTAKMQEYILHGGVYGNLDNRVAVQQKKRGGKVRYILSRIFLSYDSLKVLYPILLKHKWLTPIMEVRRWFRLLFKGKMKSSLHELNVNKSMSKEQIENTAQLLRQLGLD